MNNVIIYPHCATREFSGCKVHKTLFAANIDRLLADAPLLNGYQARSQPDYLNE
jgi:hypothetical protein